MFNNAQEGNLDINGSTMNYVSFGKGEKPFIILPGLGDGFKTVRGTSIPLSFEYKKYAEYYKVYVFSRKSPVPQGYNTRDMARDQAIAMKELGIDYADIMGISQGGMIAQYLAIDYPELVDKLVLAVTLSKQTKTVQKNLKYWIEWAEQRSFRKVFKDMNRKLYTRKYLRSHRLTFRIFQNIFRPRSYERFIIHAYASKTHNAHSELHKITSPTLIIGGAKDLTLGEGTSEEIATEIKNSKLLIYEDYGHSAFIEAPDFNSHVLEFLLK